VQGNESTGSEVNNDDLPEGLRGLEKELIEKTQSTIVNSGEKVVLDDIAGLNNAKKTVKEMVILPMKRPDLFTRLRLPPKGLLLFGPPGTGKTLIGKAIAHECKATFFSLSKSSLITKWQGDGEQLVKTLFAVAHAHSPSVVFIDEVDSMLTQRTSDESETSRGLKTEFLVQLEGVGNERRGSVLVIGATNLPWELDDAARRRFVKKVYVPLPTQPARETLLRNLLAKNQINRNSLTDENMNQLSHATNGFSGADMKNLITDAALGPVRELGDKDETTKVEEVPPISYEHFCSSSQCGTGRFGRIWQVE